MKPRLHYDNYRRAYYFRWDADSGHMGWQEPVFERTREYICELEADNAKLRELCVHMVKTVECSSDTKMCALFSECTVGGFEPCLYEQELRELGIEVPR